MVFLRWRNRTFCKFIRDLSGVEELNRRRSYLRRIIWFRARVCNDDHFIDELTDKCLCYVSHEKYDFKKTQLWLGITGLLGISFLGLEIYEFTHYITEYGFTFRSSA